MKERNIYIQLYVMGIHIEHARYLNTSAHTVVVLSWYYMYFAGHTYNMGWGKEETVVALYPPWDEVE